MKVIQTGPIQAPEAAIANIAALTMAEVLDAALTTGDKITGGKITVVSTDPPTTVEFDFDTDTLTVNQTSR